MTQSGETRERERERAENELRACRETRMRERKTTSNDTATLERVRRALLCRERATAGARGEWSPLTPAGAVNGAHLLESHLLEQVTRGRIRRACVTTPARLCSSLLSLTYYVLYGRSGDGAHRSRRDRADRMSEHWAKSGSSRQVRCSCLLGNWWYLLMILLMNRTEFIP